GGQGGGSAGAINSSAATDGTGGGSGGGGYSDASGYGSSGDGGSGIVLIRRLTADSATASGGTTSTSGDYTYHSFTATGASTYTA
ncbi:MAG: hypothetical protein QF535_06800, partial [Anaerolineales bacterium]|nr:hypothetical protein [Anaerolineales bacterium]